MKKIPFQEDELKILKKRFFFGEELNVLNTPISPLENMKNTLENRPMWQCSINDYSYLYPLCVPDNKAKGNVSDVKLAPEELGGIDMFGIEWEYQADIGGSTVRPGKPLLADANEWKDKIVFPTKETIDRWDWESCKKNSPEVMEGQYFCEPVICTGWFERLISFMDFANASMALIDPEQKDAVNELFDRLSDLYMILIDKFIETFPGHIHRVCLHDDWGHQHGMILSPATVKEMIVPHMKKVTDHLHSKGILAEIHSCGKVEPLIPAMIDAGFSLLENQSILDFDDVVPRYGDKIKVHMPPENVPPEDAPAEAFRQCARNYVEKVIKLGNPVILETFYSSPLTPEFWEELYRYSRIRFLESQS